jgi:hypothetical protein
MVSAPASSPASVSCLRSRRTSSTVACGVSVGVVFGRPRPGFERDLALGLESGLQLVHPGAVHPVPGGDLGRSLVLDEQGRDDQACFRT